MTETKKAPALVTLGASRIVRKLGSLNNDHLTENTLNLQACYVARRFRMPAHVAAAIAEIAFQTGRAA